VSDTGWELRFRQGDEESARIEQQPYQRNVVTNDAGIRPRAIRLLEYLEAIRNLREQPVRDVAEYQDRRWWAGDIPAHSSCVLTATGTEPWLVVSKAPIPPVPPVPEDVIPHLQIGVSNPEREPAFVVDFDDRFADDPAEAARLQEILLGYVEGPWQAWAPRARTALQARRLYEDLYDLRLRLQREAAQIELVWGHGILSWAVDGTRIVHPLVTTQVQLSFDADSGAISVEPEALVPHLEIDLLQGLGLKGFDLLVDIRERFRTDPIGPFDERADHLYEQLLAPLGLDGQVAEGTRPAVITAAPTITATWVLLVRRRSTMFRRFFANMRNALLSQQMTVAAPLAAVVADEPSRLSFDLDPGEERSWQQAAERLLMPLPTNPEQETVARRLAQHRGVTVQGPPGTGKTHTIANLISHLVGHGKRVLVTSQKEQALVVLRNKIPESIRDLSVAVLGSSASSLVQLDQSVQAIYEHAVGLDRPSARARITALDAHLGDLHRDIGALRTRISVSIARERETYTIGTATHTPSTLGQWLNTNAADLGYIPDGIDPTAPCPLAGAEIADLYRLAKVLDPADCFQARLYIPPAQQIPQPSEMASITVELHDIRDRLATTEGLIEDRLTLESLGPDSLSTLTEATERAARQLAELEQPWLAAIRSELRTAVFAANWRDQMKAWNEGIEELSAWQGRLLGHSVVLPADGWSPTELIEQLHQLHDRLSAGKGVSRTFQKDLHRLREACSVDDEPPRRAEDAELCIMEARSRRRRSELVRGWNDAVSRISGPLIDPANRHPEYLLHQYMGGVTAAFAWEDRAWHSLQERLRISGVRVPDQATSVILTRLAETLRTAALHIREKNLAGLLNATRNYLVDNASLPQASGLWQELLDAFDASAWDRLGQIIEEIRRIHSLADDVACFDELTIRLAGAAPIWTSRITESRGDEIVAGLAATALEAWEWRQADTWLNTITGADDPATLQRQLEGKLQAAAKVTSNLASESAWLALADRLTDAERRSLTAWAQALRKVGKGTGKYASHWRAIAQQEMIRAQAAVPVWIMPTHRVVESFDPATAMFDVVIVDESSQCDLFGLAALGIARKAVVVGDDKQISPQAIGTDESAVHELIRQHIHDLPQAELLDIKTSLYDLSKMRFPGVIMLREHFRCLPEIIEFSNQLAYGGKILPLREQPADTAWQSVIDVHIHDGYRERGTDANRPEAEYIVGKIAELCADPRYDGKTFGVISLLSDAQAQLIEGMLRDKLGEQEVERRRIRCGNAYHFQGDERHVMFLSLVVTAGEGRRIGAMTKEADRQRINVAASRARDQMWCVRSISPEELNPDDVRGRFIRYCQNPARVDEATSEVDERFDSDFEREVYRHLVARGYRVKVQHPVGRFRIDLVVEGQHKRLAVELDGDAYQGPDRWEADRNRQTILERLGWTFHRIRGSAYYRDPDAALTTLWDRLEALGIRPADASDPTPHSTITVTADNASNEAAVEEVAETGNPAAAPVPSKGERSDHSYVPRHSSGHSSSSAPAFSYPSPETSESPNQMDDYANSFTAQPSVEAQEAKLTEPEGATGDIITGERLPTLSVHRAWLPHRVPDVRSSPPQQVIIEEIIDIVAAEGPVITERIYELYLRASGGIRVTKPIRDALGEATATAVKRGQLKQIQDRLAGRWVKTLYLPRTPSIVLRRRGDRELEDIPPTEVAAVARHIISSDPSVDYNELKRLILTAFERTRMTAPASRFLDGCIALARRHGE
jgi:very-short-patch-repair endonuclease